MSNDLPLTTSGTIASNIQIIFPDPWRVGIEWKETERGKEGKGRRSIELARRSVVREACRKRSGATGFRLERNCVTRQVRSCARARWERRKRGRKWPRAGGRRKERKKGVDAGNRTADSQLLTWVNGLPTVSMPPSFAANLFLRRQRSSFLILLHSPDYTKRTSFRELEEISKIHN